MTDELQLSFTDNAFHDSMFNWVAGINPGLDLAERIRRRIELHELSMELGYSMPHSKKELSSMYQLAQNIKTQPKNRLLIPITPV
jgi:hypothetical protein